MDVGVGVGEGEGEGECVGVDVGVIFMCFGAGRGFDAGGDGVDTAFFGPPSGDVLLPPVFKAVVLSFIAVATLVFLAVGVDRGVLIAEMEFDDRTTNGSVDPTAALSLLT